VVDRTASLVVEWQRVGFVHGVMNTDNMSILGLSIDYGPYSFVDNYDAMFTPNTTDLPGRRYAFGRQGAVAKWNLGCLGGALSPLFSGSDELVKIIDTYDDVYWKHYYTMIGNKIGLDEARTEDVELMNNLEKMLRTMQPDMTIFYQLLVTLPNGDQNKEGVADHFAESFYGELSEQQAAELFHWITAYTERLQSNRISPEASKEKMKKANPRFILRNYLLHQAIEELEKGNDALFQKLHTAIQKPYEDLFPELWGRRPSWAEQKAGCSMLSCSS
jgi:uncharacterized protein YdiU (UPF0061 family)